MHLSEDLNILLGIWTVCPWSFHFLIRSTGAQLENWMILIKNSGQCFLLDKAFSWGTAGNSSIHAFMFNCWVLMPLLGVVFPRSADFSIQDFCLNWRELLFLLTKDFLLVLSASTLFCLVLLFAVSIKIGLFYDCICTGHDIDAKDLSI